MNKGRIDDNAAEIIIESERSEPCEVAGEEIDR